MESKGESESNILIKYDELERNASQSSPQLGLIKATVLKMSNQNCTVAHCSKTDHRTLSSPQEGCFFLNYFILFCLIEQQCL